MKKIALLEVKIEQINKPIIIHINEKNNNILYDGLCFRMISKCDKGVDNSFLCLICDKYIRENNKIWS